MQAERQLSSSPARRLRQKYEIDGDTLTLCDAGGNESLIFTAAVLPRSDGRAQVVRRSPL